MVKAPVLALVQERWSGRPGIRVDELDGISVDHPEWWFNLRASNTEPLLRLNVEVSTSRPCAWCATRCSRRSTLRPGP